MNVAPSKFCFHCFSAVHPQPCMTVLGINISGLAKMRNNKNLMSNLPKSNCILTGNT